MDSTALVLEGGAYRGQFTAGVLDILLEAGIIHFDAIYGVSAGSLVAMSYMSQQIGRANRVNLALRDDKRYMSFHAFFTTGSMFSPDFVYQTVQDELDPFDYEQFNETAKKTSFYATVSNLLTGQAEYQPVKELPRDYTWIQASATLPVISKIVWQNETPYLDGGVADSVPLERCVADGYRKRLVVLTQHRTFVKKPYSYPHLVNMRYEEYPEFIKTLSNRHRAYNAQRDYIFDMERRGEALVIAPPRPVALSNVKHAGAQLLDLYIQGRQEGARNLAEIERYLAS